MCCCDMVYNYDTTVVIEVFFRFLMSVSCFKIYKGLEMKSGRSGLLEVVVYT
jgi:hypothetical protein